jgi:hypothetical protein
MRRALLDQWYERGRASPRADGPGPHHPTSTATLTSGSDETSALVIALAWLAALGSRLWRGSAEPPEWLGPGQHTAQPLPIPWIVPAS